MPDPDPRLHAFRPDLAEAALEGVVAAERYTAGRPAVVCVGTADLRRAPDPALGIDTQLLFGERVTCFDIAAGYAWVKNERDGYVGYLRADALDEPRGAATHEVAALRTFLYPEPDMKTPVRAALSMTSPLAIIGERDGYGELAGGGWVFLGHLATLGDAALGDAEPDHVASALRFVGLPYRWGGRASDGLDCSALVQLALQRAGRACPRDSDMQAGALGMPLDPAEGIERGDLLFFPGHVAIALDGASVVHASAYGMLVRTEPLEPVVARSIAESGRGLTGHRRLAPSAP